MSVLGLTTLQDRFPQAALLFWGEFKDTLPSRRVVLVPNSPKVM